MLHRPVRAALASAVLIASAGAQTIELVSLTSASGQTNARTELMTRASADGRFVVFATTATNLFPNDLPGTREVFLRDRQTGTTTRVAGPGVPADLSSDGTRLAYTEYLSSPAGPTLPFAHLIALPAGTDQPLTSSETSLAGSFSADGRFLVYARDPAQAEQPRVVVRRELATASEELVSSNMFGQPAQGSSALPGGVAFDGSLVTFTTDAADIVPGDTNARRDAFYHDFNFGFSDRYGLTDQGAEIPGISQAGALTPDTRFILFGSSVDGVAEGDANGKADLFTYDRFFAAVAIVSVDSGALPADGDSSVETAWISPDGERIIFQSRATNLVPGDTNQLPDVFERNVGAGTTRRLVLGLGGAQPDAGALLAGVSADGRFLSIVSSSTNLVAGDTNGLADAFLVDLGPQCAVSGYCSANANSTGVPASISSTGTPSFALNNFVISGLDLPDPSTALFVHGTARVDPPLPFGDGLSCVGGTLVRLGTLPVRDGTVIQFQDLGSPAYALVQPGDVRRFQLVYRDVAAQGAGFNTTPALEVMFCP